MSRRCRRRCRCKSGGMGSDARGIDLQAQGGRVVVIWTQTARQRLQLSRIGESRQGQNQASRGKSSPFSMGKQAKQPHDRRRPTQAAPKGQGKGMGCAGAGAGAWTRNRDVFFLPYLRLAMQPPASPVASARGRRSRRCSRCCSFVQDVLESSL